jgi:large subunit ribosomal protein L25
MNQVKLAIDQRSDTGKGAAGRLRTTGRVPGVVYGYDVDPTAVSVDDRELYHALHGPAGTNVLLVIDMAGEDRLCVARDIQRHPVRGNVTHVDLLSVDKNATIVVDIPVHLEGGVEGGGIVNQVIGSVPIHVAPLNTPNSFSLNVDGMEIGDTLRVSDLVDQLPEGAEFDIDEERTVVTVNAPEAEEVEEEESALGEFAGDGEEGEAAAEGEGAPAEDAPAEGDEG